jgi:DNA-directed RNA polymerase specialized sigma24 family protein
MGAMTRTAVGERCDALAAAAAGDEFAFRRLIARQHEDMRRVCRAIAADDVVADEAVAAAWAVAWKKLGKVRGPD